MLHHSPPRRMSALDLSSQLRPRDCSSVDAQLLRLIFQHLLQATLLTADHLSDRRSALCFDVREEERSMFVTCSRLLHQRLQQSQLDQLGLDATLRGGDEQRCAPSGGPLVLG